jgi:hypothetical protein
MLALTRNLKYLPIVLYSGTTHIADFVQEMAHV